MEPVHHPVHLLMVPLLETRAGNQAGGDGVFERLYHAALQQVVFLRESIGMQASKRKDKEYIYNDPCQREIFFEHIFF